MHGKETAIKRIIACFAIAAFLFCLCCIAAMDDDAGSRPKEPAERSRFEIETGLMEVRAVVTDQKGRIVKGLEKDDFELLENDVPREISHFAVSKIESERGNAAAKETGAQDKELKLAQARLRLSRPPVRTVLLYADALHLSFTSLNWVKKALRRFIDEQLTDQDLVAFTSSETLGVAQQFTRDRKILRYAVEQIRYGPANRETDFTPNLAAEFIDGRTEAVRLGIDIMRQEENFVCPCSDLRTLAYQKAYRVLDEASYARENTLSIIEHFSRQMADLPGKRMIVIFSDGFTLNNRIGALQNEELRGVVSRAVRSGVVIYTIDAGGLRPPPEIDAARRSPARDIQYEMLVRCLQACPEDDTDCLNSCVDLHPVLLRCREDIGSYKNPECDYPEPGLLATYLGAFEIDRLNGLHSMAVDTGGKMYDKTNDLNGALGQALDDNQFFYVLSYYLESGNEDDRFRRIEVRVRNHPEYKVRTPRGFWPSKIRESLESEAGKTPQQRLIQAMGSPLPLTDLGVSVRADFIETENDDKQVSLVVFFEGDRLQYREREGGRDIELELMSFIFDSSGNRADGVSASVTGSMPEGDMAKAQYGGYRFSRRLALKPGVYQARVGVREEGTDRMGTATTWVEVPEIVPDKLEMSSLILGNPLDTSLPDKEGIDLGGLEQIKMVQGIPMYSTDDIFYYSFRVHRDSPAPGEPELSMMSELLQGGEPVRKEKWSPISTERMDMDGKGWIDLDGEMDIGALRPGIYELHVSVKGSSSEKIIRRTAVFGIL